MKLNAYSADEAGVLRGLADGHDTEVRFYASWLLARNGDKHGLSQLADPVNYKGYSAHYGHLSIGDWLTVGSGWKPPLSSYRLMKLLRPLAPIAASRSTPKAWATTVRGAIGELDWDQASGTFILTSQLQSDEMSAE